MGAVLENESSKLGALGQAMARLGSISAEHPQHSSRGDHFRRGLHGSFFLLVVDEAHIEIKGRDDVERVPDAS